MKIQIGNLQVDIEDRKAIREIIDFVGERTIMIPEYGCPDPPDYYTLAEGNVDNMIIRLWLNGKSFSAGVILDKATAEENIHQAENLFWSGTRRLKQELGEEREFIKKAKKAGEPFPVKNILLKWPKN